MAQYEDDQADGEDFSSYPALRGVTIVGNLGGDPNEVPNKKDPNSPGIGFSVGTNSVDFRGTKGSVFFGVVAWGYTAAGARRLDLKKGDKVVVVGDVYIREYEGKPQFDLNARVVGLVSHKRPGGRDMTEFAEGALEAEEARASRSSRRTSAPSGGDPEETPRTGRRSQSAEQPTTGRSSRSSSASDEDPWRSDPVDDEAPY